ncbi:MAG: UTP--glucose-1-phosphate uridylyltransferase, partial [Selenomonadales bacterium]|nr:UTP--glucose-1-phosphate uridylyltransferase [Selenomonadales bacterium]
GIEEILIITGRNKRAIEDHFDRSVELELLLSEQDKGELLHLVQEIADIDIHYIRQKEAKGLGHAILCARQFVGNEPFAVMLGDDVVDADSPCLGQLIDKYNEYQGSILGVQEVADDKVSSYGIVSPEMIADDVWRVRDLIEKPAVGEAPSNLAVLGRYIISPKVFDILATQQPGKGGEIQLTDALCTLAKDEPMYAYRFKGRRYDIGDKQGFLEATVEFALKRPELRRGFVQYLADMFGRETSDRAVEDILAQMEHARKQ